MPRAWGVEFWPGAFLWTSAHYLVAPQFPLASSSSKGPPVSFQQAQAQAILQQAQVSVPCEGWQK